MISAEKISRGGKSQIGLPHSNKSLQPRETRRLASAYMLRYVSLCGGVEESIRRGSMWEVPVRFGFAGTPRYANHVDRATGLVSYSYESQRYPTVTPKQLADEIYRLTHRQ